MKQEVLDLIKISQYAGNRADYTQGGGGNTSVKVADKGLMLIKASGFKLSEITETNAYVAVDQNKVFNYYNSVDLSVEKDYEKESAEIAKSSVVPLEGLAVLRPSVEVGFHSILKKYVVHTHSVYGNLIACCLKGEELAKKLLTEKDYDYIFLPYINPGFSLTLAMKNEIEKHIKETGKYPEVIFMKNHGIVVNGDDIDRVIAVNTDLNETIRKYFKLDDDFRAVSLKEENGVFVSQTKIVTDFIKSNTLNKELLDSKPLYPDQLVYLNNILAFSPDTMKVENGEVRYNADIKKATTLEETLSAYLFVVANIEKAGLPLSTMNEKEVYFINNWEAEKYRRSVK